MVRAEAKAHGGGVPKGSYAAGMQSRLDKREASTSQTKSQEQPRPASSSAAPRVPATEGQRKR